MSRVIAVKQGPERRVIRAGMRGRVGPTITAASVAENGHLIITLEGGTQVDAGYIGGSGGAWGSIPGDITQQLDLMMQLGLKVSQSSYDAFALGVNAALAARYTKAETDDLLGGKVDDDDSRLTNSRPPTGAAGGVLSGTYPNPGFAEDMATRAELDTKVDKVTGKGLSTNDFTDSLYNKLAGLESSHFRGTFTSLAALEAGVASPVAGGYADVDSGPGVDVLRYIWDANDNKWVAQSGESTSLTAAQVKTLYESNPDTNGFTDGEKGKLAGIAPGATENQTDAYLRNRANHTGTQTASTISDFAEAASAAAPVQDGDARLANARDWTAAEVSQSEAEEGTATTPRKWTALRDRQATAAWWNSITSVFGRTFVNSADAAAARSAIGLENAVVSDGSVAQVIKLTQAEYDALGTPDSATLYVVVG